SSPPKIWFGLMPARRSDLTTDHWLQIRRPAAARAAGLRHATSCWSEHVEVEVHVSTVCGIEASGVAAGTGHHVLVLVYPELVDLGGIRIRVDLGGIVAALRTLASVRRGGSAMGLRKP